MHTWVSEWILNRVSSLQWLSWFVMTLNIPDCRTSRQYTACLKLVAGNGWETKGGVAKGCCSEKTSIRKCIGNRCQGHYYSLRFYPYKDGSQVIDPAILCKWYQILGLTHQELDDKKWKSCDQWLYLQTFPLIRSNSCCLNLHITQKGLYDREAHDWL